MTGILCPCTQDDTNICTGLFCACADSNIDNQVWTKLHLNAQRHDTKVSKPHMRVYKCFMYKIYRSRGYFGNGKSDEFIFLTLFLGLYMVSQCIYVAIFIALCLESNKFAAILTGILNTIFYKGNFLKYNHKKNTLVIWFF